MHQVPLGFRVLGFGVQGLQFRYNGSFEVPFLGIIKGDASGSFKPRLATLNLP